MKTVENGVPRRNRLDLNAPAELAIRKAMEEVEKIGADPRLTSIVYKLEKCFNRLADYVDSKEIER